MTAPDLGDDHRSPRDRASGPGDRALQPAPNETGTLDAPRQDLSPRIMAAIKDDPGAALGLFFRQLGVWLKGAFGSD